VHGKTNGAKLPDSKPAYAELRAQAHCTPGQMRFARLANAHIARAWCLKELG
jgi:hypothetical protein